MKADQLLAVIEYEKAATQGYDKAAKALKRMAFDGNNPAEAEARKALFNVVRTGKVLTSYWKDDADGNGLIEIYYLEQLDQMRHSPAGTHYKLSATDIGSNTGCPAAGCTGFELANDLDFNNPNSYASGRINTAWTTGRGWTPIGIGLPTDNITSFNAVFDGNGHIIKGLFINNTQPNQRASLFAFASSKSILRNLELQNVNITATRSYAAALVGETYGKVQNIVVNNATISGNSYVGSIAGYVIDRSFMSNVLAKNITVRGSGFYVGAITGYLFNDAVLQQASVLNNSLVHSTSSHVGGLVGVMGAGTTLVNSFTKARVVGTSHVGGMAGQINGASIKAHNILSLSRVFGSGSNVNKLFGELSASSVASLSTSGLLVLNPISGGATNIHSNHRNAQKSETELKDSNSAFYDTWKTGAHSGIKWDAASGNYVTCDVDVSASDDCSVPVWKFPTGRYPRHNYENYPVPVGQKKFWTADRIARLYAN